MTLDLMVWLSDHLCPLCGLLLPGPMCLVSQLIHFMVYFFLGILGDWGRHRKTETDRQT
jgi:hypothetical protein